MAVHIGDARASLEVVVDGPTPAPYRPGELYRRELPGILDVLSALEREPDLVVVDGYVSLANGAPGLGAHLYRALEERVQIIGVAKTRFSGAGQAVRVYRGSSEKPLFVTAAGL